MDLHAMLNDGDAPPKKSSTGSQRSPSISSRGSAPQAGPGPASTKNGAYTPGAGGAYALPPRHEQGTPQFGPPSASAGTPSQSQSRGLTPLHTASQGAASGQYPFPQQQPPLQSPTSAQVGQQQQYRPYEAYSATTPGVRPPSHGYPQPSPSAGQFQLPRNAHPSLSPTPPSHYGQTPQTMHQSPMTTMGHPQVHQQQQPPPPQYYHQSQPNTPLGPPSLPQRHSNTFPEAPSPNQQRTFSATSNGMMSASPAHPHQHGAPVMGSPAGYGRPSPGRRRTSDTYRSSMDQERQRSESVSPKTVVQPRPPSLGSRHSSQQDLYSARSSMQPSASVPPHSVTPTQVQPPPSTYAQPQQTYSSNGVSQASSQTSSPWPVQPIQPSPLSQPDNKTPLQHQPQKIGMNQLLAPTTHAQHPHPSNAIVTHEISTKVEQSQPQHYSQPSPAASAISAQSYEQPPAHLKPEKSTSADSSIAPYTSSQPASVSPLQQRSTDMIKTEAASTKTPLKRAAETRSSAEPPAKRGRNRKYRERPSWAHLHPNNPRARQAGIAQNSREVSAQQPPHANVPKIKSERPPTRHHPNGHQQPPQTNGSTAVKPWLQEPPLDDDLIKARRVLGIPWEPCINYVRPIPELNKEIGDWLFGNLQAQAHIGRNASEGAIEIEAKLGRLIDKNTHQRVRLPVRTPCVVENGAMDIAFESRMQDSEHKNMNQLLNTILRTSMEEKGREKIHYKHIYETDSFQTLTDAGLAALPEVAHANNRRAGRQMHLRTSRDDKDGGRVVARIIKIKLCDDLHIFGGTRLPYDVRISMNLEVNLIDRYSDHFVVHDAPPPQASRKKDRLSYKHLNDTFSIDLTRVDQSGQEPSYELELELDSNRVRDQIENLQQGRPNAFIQVVDSYVDNISLLMRPA